MYAMTCTTPDITFAVAQLSRFTQKPGPTYWRALRRVLRYFIRTKDYGLFYRGDHPVLEGYFDATWASNKEDNSST